MENSKNKTEEKVFTAGEVGSMLESIDSTMKMMAENHSGVIKRLDSIDNRLDGIDNRLDGVENRLEKVEQKVDRLQDDMVEVKYDLKQKPSTDDFKKLEKRVTKLERLSLAH